jgi:hypothetical protein
MARDHRHDAVANALEQYAARGVFRGFAVGPQRNGRREFHFTWLTPHPMTITYEPAARLLTFRHLLPRVDEYPGLVDELAQVLDDHRNPDAPAHRRIDARRARVAGSTRGGSFSITVQVRGNHGEYAVQRGLNLVNQMFLLLQARYPEYLVECFGLRSE